MEKKRLIIVALLLGSIPLIHAVFITKLDIFSSALFPFIFLTTSKLLIVSGIFLIAYVIGSLLLPSRINDRDNTSPIGLMPLFSMGLGAGVIALSVLCIGLIVGFYRILFIALYCAGVLGGFVYLRHRRQLTLTTQRVDSNRVQKEANRHQGTPRDYGWFFACLILSLLLLLYFFSSLTPPVSYDVLEYHLAAPQEWIREHSFKVLPHVMFSHLPLNMEMLYAFGMMIENVHDSMSPKLINFFFLLFVLICSGYWAARAGLSRTWSLVVLIMLLSHLIILRVAVDAMNDLAVCLWCLLAIMAWYFWTVQTESTDLLLLLAGCFMGFAIGSKYTVIFLYLIPFVVLLIPGGLYLKRRTNGKIYLVGIIRAYLLFLIPVFLTFLPWALKNMLINRNPFYPFLSTVFPVEWWSSHQETFYLECRQQVAPWQAVFWINLVRRLHIPGFLFFLPAFLIFIIPQRDRLMPRLRLLSLFSIVSYCIWNLWATSADRFLVVLIPILSLISVSLFSRYLPAFKSGKILSLLFLTAIGLQLLICIFTFSLINVSYYGLIPSLRKEFRTSYLGDFEDALTYINEHLPPDSKVLLIYEARSYYIHQSVVVNSVFDQSPLLRWIDERRKGEATGGLTLRLLYEKLEAEKVTHCLVNEHELMRLIDFFAPVEAKERIGFPCPPERSYILYPPWYNNDEFAYYAPVVGAFLEELKRRAEFIKTREGLSIYLAAIESPEK